MLTLALENPGWAARVPAGAKLAALLGATVLVYPVHDPALLAGILLAVGGLYLSLGRVAMKAGLRMLRPLLLICAMILLYHLIIGTPMKALVILLKILVMVGLANFVTMTTRLSDMMAVVMRLLAPLRRFGVNTHALALALALVIRFTPVLILKSKALTEAWRARSPARAGWRVIVPLVLLALDDADHVAEALRARGGVENE